MFSKCQLILLSYNDNEKKLSYDFNNVKSIHWIKSKNRVQKLILIIYLLINRYIRILDRQNQSFKTIRDIVSSL